MPATPPGIPSRSISTARAGRIARVGAAAAVLVLAACRTTPGVGDALSAGSQARIEGTVHAVDTAPWAYDGPATVTIDTATHGRIRVQLPARWNLCQAAAPPDPNTLRPGDRVRAIGTVSPEGALVVCEQDSHRLERVQD